MRHFVAPETAGAERRQFAEDVEYYLSLSPRQLPSRYLYDDLGSALFDAICHLPWYEITRTERDLLRLHAGTILHRLEPLATLVELGPGNGDKLADLLDTAADDAALTVHLVDISPSALEASSRALDDRDNVTIVTHQAEYETGLAAATAARESRGSFGRTLALFLGSNIGNFDPPGADAFLLNIRAALSQGDAFLIGADLVKDEAALLQAYDDPLGVTAAFNRNLLVRVNQELDADFDLDGFAHRAVWNPAASRIEMHLVSRRRQRVRIPCARLDIVFEPDETIWTESSYKYQPRGMLGMLERAGFRKLNQWLDERGTFALTLVEAA
ncbi:MAG TPA: L-histidine N(alpha)-methyltransferase [Vicinamibacterales bacterium]|jgi:dimethylhistidine N-methyltransferase